MVIRILSDDSGGGGACPYNGAYACVGLFMNFL